MQRTRPVPPEPGTRLGDHAHPRRPAHGDDAAQQYHPLGVSGKRQRLTTLDHPVVGDPPGTPDEAARLVAPAPHVAHVLRGHGKGAAAADQRGEHGIGIPVGGAHPGDVPLRADESAALPVGQQRVLAQHMRGKHLLDVDALLGAHSVLLTVAGSAALLSGARRALVGPGNRRHLLPGA